MNFDTPGPWQLDVGGCEVTDVALDGYRVAITTSGLAEQVCKINLAQTFELRKADGIAHVLEPRSTDETLAALRALQHDRVALLGFSDVSELHVEFESGHQITCQPDRPFEPWEIVGPGPILVVGTADRPAIWDGDPKNTVRWKHGRFYDTDGNEVPEPEWLKDCARKFPRRSDTP